MPTMEFRWNPNSPANLRPIFDACIKSLQSKFSMGGVSLVLGGLKPAHQTHRHLAGSKSPKGEIVSDSDGDTQIVRFKAVEVLAWMTALKFCSATHTPYTLHAGQEVNNDG